MKKFLLIGVIGGWFIIQHYGYIVRLWHAIPGVAEKPVYIFKGNNASPLPAGFPLPAEQTFIFKKIEHKAPKPVEEVKSDHRKGGVRITEAFDLWKGSLLWF